jgi:uncharacterized NAD(P)/FAD-binding protein YdhS
MSAAPPLPPTLQHIVSRLDGLGERTSETLATALDAPLSLDDVADFAHLSHTNYRRNLVLRRPEYELRLLCWLPGQRTSLHGHDGSACAFRIVSGISTEILLGEPDNRWTAGQVIAERGDNFVHQVTNLDGEPLLSLHAYAPALPIDQPPQSYEGRHIIIIGGGVSGTALAIHLLQRSHDRLRITIVERRQWLGRGPAYGTTDPAFRLNVPAERMSLFPDRSDDFANWARQQGESIGPGALLPRKMFGEYVEDRLGAAITRSRGKVWLHRTAAVSAAAEGVLLGDGTLLRSDAVVLATGNQLPSAPSVIPAEALRTSRVIADPWTDGALASITRDEVLLLVGTGLTAVDVLLALRNQGHRGQVVAVSRRGLLPRPHLDPDDPGKRAITIDPARLPGKARLLSRFLRQEARNLARDGIAWQNLIDALRPHTVAIWSALPQEEKARFIKKLSRYWEVLRHRASGEALSTVEGWRRAGKLRIVAGAIKDVEVHDKGLDIKLDLRDGTRDQRRYDRIILCTGPQTDVRLWRSLLFRDLLRTEQITPDPLGLGIVTDDEGRAMDGGGHPSAWLYAIGGLRRPRLWETTSVPDIVRQAASLAELLCQ